MIMSYGATVGGRDCPTKKALKAALAEDPASVYLYGTSPFGDEPDLSGWELEHSDVVRRPLTVVGPNPYKRSWYATVEIKAGKVVVR